MIPRGRATFSRVAKGLENRRTRQPQQTGPQKQTGKQFHPDHHNDPDMTLIRSSAFSRAEWRNLHVP